MRRRSRSLVASAFHRTFGNNADLRSFQVSPNLQVIADNEDKRMIPSTHAYNPTRQPNPPPTDPPRANQDFVMGSVQKSMKSSLVSGNSSGPSRPKPLKIEVNSFIPMETVPAPYRRGAVGSATFAGDGRDIGETGTHRTQQMVVITPTPGSKNPYDVKITPNTGLTKAIDANGRTIDSAHATTKLLTSKKEQFLPDGSIEVHLTGSAADPLVPGAPSVTYDMVLNAKPNQDGSWKVSVDGKHDQFPAYEVKASTANGKPEVIYGFDPRPAGTGVLALLQGDALYRPIWGDGTQASGSARIEAANPDPSQLLAEFTSGGQIQSKKLGSELATMAEYDLAVSSPYVTQVMAGVPAAQRGQVADSFFSSLRAQTGPGGSAWHANHVVVAGSLRGISVLLALGAHTTPASEGVAGRDVIGTSARTLREPVYNGNPQAAMLASKLLDQSSDSPASATFLAEFLDPLYDDDAEGMSKTPEGRALHQKIERALQN